MISSNQEATADMVERVAREIQFELHGAGDVRLHADCDELAKAALEASHHAELVEAVRIAAHILRFVNSEGLEDDDLIDHRIELTVADTRTVMMTYAKIAGDP
jgi:hypothetical protein